MAAEASASVLVIDDEEQIRRALRSILTSHGYSVLLAGSAEEAVRAAADAKPDLIVLDLTLPDADGIDLAGELRAWISAPILVLSVRGGDEDKIAALDAGADDYLTKPFSAGELLARVRALLRRSVAGAGAPAAITAGDLEIDLARRRVTKAGVEVTLTKTEFDILALLASNPDRVLTSRMILEHVWGPEYAEDRQTLRVHISHLRKKIESHPSVPRYVQTEPGVGFIFSTR
jgi:two-component system KDP operon response regulator KdpE